MPAHHFILNGQTVTVEAPEDLPLLWALRDVLGVTGPKYGCGVGVCGACTSHLEGTAFRPCIQPVGGVTGRQVTTIEGLGGEGLHPVQQAWIDEDVAQCGFCQPGQIMAAVAKVQEVKGTQGKKRITNKDIDEIRNMCRCGTYPRILTAIQKAAAVMAKGVK